MLIYFNKSFVFLLSIVVIFFKVTHVFSMDLQPHIATYDLMLSRADEKSGIAGVDGLLVYEFTGSVCEGYTVNYRFVTRVADNDGRVRLTDMRVNSFEEGDGSGFTFLTQFFANNQLSEETRGTAKRDKEGVQVQLIKPKKDQVLFSGNVMFPTEQTMRLIEAANSGQIMYSTALYDGSDDGKKSYLSSAVIGAPIDAGDGVGVGHVLGDVPTAKLRRWPIEIAYFDHAESGDVTPDYVVSFDLFEDGVSWHPVFNYGHFILTGKMRSLQPLKARSCP